MKAYTIRISPALGEGYWWVAELVGHPNVFVIDWADHISNAWDAAHAQGQEMLRRYPWA